MFAGVKNEMTKKNATQERDCIALSAVLFRLSDRGKIASAIKPCQSGCEIYLGFFDLEA